MYTYVYIAYGYIYLFSKMQNMYENNITFKSLMIFVIM